MEDQLEEDIKLENQMAIIHCTLKHKLEDWMAHQDTKEKIHYALSVKGSSIQRI